MIHWLTLFTAEAIHPYLRNGTGTTHDSQVEFLETKKKLDRVFGIKDGLTISINESSFNPSEHAEALVRVLQTIVNWPNGPYPWPTDALAKANAAKCTYYFSYYKHLAMFGREDAPFDYMTDVGAYTSAPSPYGTFDQGGNVREWNETPVPNNREPRGGSRFESRSRRRSS